MKLLSRGGEVGIAAKRYSELQIEHRLLSFSFVTIDDRMVSEGVAFAALGVHTIDGGQRLSEQGGADKDQVLRMSRCGGNQPGLSASMSSEPNADATYGERADAVQSGELGAELLHLLRDLRIHKRVSLGLRCKPCKGQ